MSGEIQLVNDGEGVAIFGDPAIIERYLRSVGLESRELTTRRLGGTMSVASAAAQAGAGLSEYSGRWVKLTKESAAALKQSTLMKGSSPDVSKAVLTDNGKIKGFLEIVRTPGAMLTNPAMLAGVSGIMAQMAMQQAMDEINDYLAVIDAKVDDVLRAQENAVLADMIGVDLILSEAETLREHTGRVSDVTWSKVQSASFSIAKTQAYAIGEINAVAEKLEKQVQLGEIASLSEQARAKVQDWLAVLARCCALQDGIAVLELDRVLDSSPEDLEQHRTGVVAARQDRLDLIVSSTQELLARVDAASHAANARVLLHPVMARATVQVGNYLAGDILDFQLRLGAEGHRGMLEARRWRDAVSDVRDKTLETGKVGVAAAARVGSDTVGRTRSMTGRAAESASRGLARLRSAGRGDEPGAEADQKYPQLDQGDEGGASSSGGSH